MEFSIVWVGYFWELQFQCLSFLRGSSPWLEVFRSAACVLDFSVAFSLLSTCHVFIPTIVSLSPLLNFRDASGDSSIYDI